MGWPVSLEPCHGFVRRQFQFRMKGFAMYVTVCLMIDIANRHIFLSMQGQPFES